MIRSMLSKRFRPIVSNEKGQDIVEYSILLALFAGVAYFFYATGVFAYMRMFLLQVFYGTIHVLERI